MLGGLLRLRRHGGGSLDLGRLLWKQVGRVVLVCCDIVDPLIHGI